MAGKASVLRAVVDAYFARLGMHVTPAQAADDSGRRTLLHQGIVAPFVPEKVPVGPSGPSMATRTASRAPCSTVSVPA
jgi:hypothetical protein